MRACAGMPRCPTRRGNTPSSWTRRRADAIQRIRAARVQDLALAGGHDWTRSVVYACGNPTWCARPAPGRGGLPPARFLSEAFLPATAGAAIDAPPRHEPWERVGRRFTMAGILDARQRSLGRARHRRADPPGHDDARRGQRRRRPSARHGRLAQLASDLCALRRRHASPAVQPTDFQRVLRDDDTFVVDIGPVWDGYEGDYGDTFVTGRDAGARCARRARVFRRTRLDWLAGATGEALYDRADAYAREYGCALVREIPGHRVSDFPHALYASTAGARRLRARRRHLGAGDPGARPDAAGRRLL